MLDTDTRRHDKVATFAFEAKCWRDTFPHSCVMDEVMRSDNPKLIAMLNEVRIGQVSAATVA